MNYNQNWNNPQQNWNQPPTPQPRKNGNKTTIIIVVIVACVVGGCFYLAAFLGKKFSETLGKAGEMNMQRVDSLREYSTAQTYTELFNEINTNQELSDSVKLDLTRNISYLQTLTDDVNALVNKYDDGFGDTLKGQNTFSLIDKKWGNAYFLKTGRAAKLKSSLQNLSESAFIDLPSEVRDSSILPIIVVYDNDDANLPEYLKNLTSWEGLYFNQPTLVIRGNFNTFRKQIRSYEDAVLERYKQYLSQNNY